MKYYGEQKPCWGVGRVHECLEPATLWCRFAGVDDRPCLANTRQAVVQYYYCSDNVVSVKISRSFPI